MGCAGLRGSFSWSIDSIQPYQDSMNMNHVVLRIVPAALAHYSRNIVKQPCHFPKKIISRLFSTTLLTFSTMSTNFPIPETKVLAIASHVGAYHNFRSYRKMADSCVKGGLWVRGRTSRCVHDCRPDHAHSDMLAIRWPPSSCNLWDVMSLP